MNDFNKLSNCTVTNKNIILRVDINVPVLNGIIQDDSRIKAIIPTLKYLVKNKAKVILISHFGRPNGQKLPEMSLGQLQLKIEELLGQKIKFVDDCIGGKVQKSVSETGYGEVILLENLRFYKEETENNGDFAKKLASLGNLYVNDAFSCCHRAHASIVGIANILKSCAGLLLEKEINNLQKLLFSPERPMLAIVGGSKVSTKIDLINALTIKSEVVFIAGGMANSFLYALGYNIGKSLCEKNLKNSALQILEHAKKNNCQIILPKDVVVCKELKNDTPYQIVSIKDVGSNDIIVDAGIQTICEISTRLQNFKTVIWNGPIGAFEIKPFNMGTEFLAKAVAFRTGSQDLISVAGGGDIVSALNASDLVNKFSYISTAGGAFLEWLEGKSLPGITILNKI